MWELCLKKYMLSSSLWVLWFQIVINHVVAEGISVLQLWQRARQQLGRITRAYYACVWISFAAIRKDYRSVKVISPEYSFNQDQKHLQCSLNYFYSKEDLNILWKEINTESSRSCLLKANCGLALWRGTWLSVGLWLLWSPCFFQETSLPSHVQVTLEGGYR